MKHQEGGLYFKVCGEPYHQRGSNWGNSLHALLRQLGVMEPKRAALEAKEVVEVPQVSAGAFVVVSWNVSHHEFDALDMDWAVGSSVVKMAITGFFVCF